MQDPLTSIYEANPDTSQDQDTLTHQETTDNTANQQPETEATDHIINYQGFASPTPYLLENPTSYINRLATAARTLLSVPAESLHPDPGTRVLYSPAISLPFFLPEAGDQMYEIAQFYPLLHLPEGRPYDDPELPIDAYALAVVIAYEMDGINLMGEPGGGDLLAWDNVPRYAVPDKYWTRALDLAQQVYRPLIAVNLARLVLAARDNQQERAQLALLCQAWQVVDTPSTLLENGRKASPIVQQYWQSLASQTPCDLLDAGDSLDGGD